MDTVNIPDGCRSREWRTEGMRLCPVVRRQGYHLESGDFVQTCATLSHSRQRGGEIQSLGRNIVLGCRQRQRYYCSSSHPPFTQSINRTLLHTI